MTYERCHVEGRGKTGRDLDGFAISGLPFVVTGTTEEQMAASATGVREQIAFHGATAAYRHVLGLHGWGDVQRDLNAMTKASRWKEVGGLIDDEILDAVAVVAEPDRVAGAVLDRARGLFTRMHLFLGNEIDREVLLAIREELRADA